MKFKKILAAVLSISLVLSLAGCSDSEKPSDSKNDKSTSDNSTAGNSNKPSANTNDDNIDNNSPTYEEPASEDDEPQWVVATAEDFEYEDTGDEIELTKYIGSGGNVIIPDTIDGKPVTVIAENAFKGKNYGYDSNLTGIVIPDSVTYIGSSAFQDCKILTDVAIGNGITKITSWCFKNCWLLENVKLGNSITYIGDNAFGACTALSNIDLPKGLTEIDSQAFSSCKKLANIILPESLTSIDKNAFLGCTALEETGVSFMGRLYDIDNELISVINDGRVYDENGLYIENNVIIDCLNHLDGEIIIPSGVTKINGRAFQSCNLTGVIIPESVIEIGYSNAFYNCRNLTSITIPNSVTELSDRCFENCTSLKSVIIGNGITELSENIFLNCENLTSVTIPDSVTKIAWGAFTNCAKLTNLTIPDSVTNINYLSAFRDCKRISATYKGKTYDYEHIQDLCNAINSSK